MKKLFFALPIALVLFLSLSYLPADPQKLSEVSDALIQRTIPTLTTGELANTLTKEKIVLLDTREKKEFEVSHLPDAQWVGYEDFKNYEATRSG